MNSNGAGFGLWAATAAGGALVELPLATSTNDIDGIESFNLWPNPSTGELTLELDATMDMNLSVMVIDATGRQISDNPVNAFTSGQNQVALDLSGNAPGMYSILISNGEGVVNIPVQLLR